ncbi:MAG: hypothetical protein WDO17_04070 [Alphaproteobacteria bacterium]
MRNIIVNAAAGFGLVAIVAAAVPNGAPELRGPAEKATAPYLTVVVPN